MHNKITKLFSLLTLAAILAVLSAGCGSSAVDISKLLSKPADYNGKVVTFDAFYFSGFEIQVLAAGLTHPPSSKDWVPAPPNIWITGNIPQSVLDQLYKQTGTPSGYDEHYGKMRVTGTFQYGGKYGHMDAYRYQLVATDATILNWMPS
jgi:hypothetical protein